MQFYINQYGTKTSKKLDKIKDRAYDYVYGGRGFNTDKFYSKKYQNLIIQFEKEAEKIGGIDYNLSDVLA
jgi:hypothetical protein